MVDIKLLLGSAFGCPDLRFIFVCFIFGWGWGGGGGVWGKCGVECDEVVESSANFNYN